MSGMGKVQTLNIRRPARQELEAASNEELWNG